MKPEEAPGRLMAREMAEACAVFARAAGADHRGALEGLGLAQRRAFYTVARGSSDAAALILAYEMMRELGRPVTSLPPSVFSLGGGVAMEQAAALVISQSGASEDLVRSARGIARRGGAVVAITNQPGSAVEAAARVTLPIGAGPERSVPATKTVVGSVAAGLALLGALRPEYRARARDAARLFAQAGRPEHPQAREIGAALLRAQHVYVIGRDAGFGAAQEVALKLKECCALHAEAYSASEVLHGPLQLVSRPLMVLMLDTGDAVMKDSLDTAEARFRAAGGSVWRMSPADVEAPGLSPAAAAAMLLCMSYPIIHAAALALGFDPDRPATLSKVTQTT